VTMARRIPFFSLLLCLCSFATAEIRSFSGLIEAASSYIHYSEGYLVAPGYVDLSNLKFSTLDYVVDEELADDKFFEGEENDDFGGEGDDGGDRMVDENPESDGSVVDIVLFHEPDDCAFTRTGCDWTKLGIGASNDNGDTGRWCCSSDAVELGYCEGGPSKYGRLIVNATLFKGQHRFIPVPPSGKMETSVKYGRLEEPQETGNYVLIIANCNDEGRDVLASGTYSWVSRHGYLPGEMFGEMYFLLFLTCVYLAIFLWYGFSMKYYEDEIIPIQRWILMTILMGLVETFFRTGDLFVWNEDGTRFWFAMYSGVLVGVLKRAISRCMLVMVSLGWGVNRDSLGSTMKKIVGLGIIYAGVAAARDIFTIIAVEEMQKIADAKEENLVDLAGIFTLLAAAIDVLFILWILDSLNATMEDLEGAGQHRKLKIFLRLRCVFLIAILFACIWIVLGLVDTYMEETIIEQESQWVLVAAMEFNYLIVLVGVAVLWRPNPNAKEFAYVMELQGNDDEDADGEIEFGVVPSAADEDDLALEENCGGGYKDDDEDEEVKVRNGVHT